MAILTAGLAVRAAPPAQAARPGGLIFGRVVDATSGAGVARAIVSLSLSNPGPVADALAVPSAAPNGRLLADGEGRFVFHDLPAGSYILSATAPGYVSGSFGQRRANGAGQLFVLGDTQLAGDATVRLWKQATLGGTVLDEYGDPIVSASVTLMQWRVAGGRREVSSFTTLRTDDRGSFRFSGLGPGQYVLAVPSSISTVPMSVAQAYNDASRTAPGGNARTTELFKNLAASSRAPSPSSAGVIVGDFLVPIGGPAQNNGLAAIDADGRIVAYATAFYPDAPTVARASPITLAPGEDRSDIVFQLRPARMTSVSGVVTGPDGPMQNLGVQLESVVDGQTSAPSAAVDAGMTLTDASGAFTFLAVPPGRYTVRASRVVRPTTSLPSTITATSQTVGGTVFSTGPGMNVGPLPPDPTLWGEAPVTVGDAPVRGLAVQLRTGLTIKGRIEFRGATRPPPERIQTMLLNFVFAGGQTVMCCPASRVASDGTFETQGWPPGRYAPVAGGPPGWSMESVTQGGRDISQGWITLQAADVSDVTIVMGDKPTTLSGSVQGASRAAIDASLVVLFPDDYEAWIANGANSRISRAIRPSSAGTYTVTGLTAGPYLIAAASEDDLADWQDASTVRKLAAIARRVTVTPGTTVTQDVTVGRIR